MISLLAGSIFSKISTQSFLSLTQPFPLVEAPCFIDHFERFAVQVGLLLAQNLTLSQAPTQITHLFFYHSSQKPQRRGACYPC